jgi:hypothetical protein
MNTARLAMACLVAGAVIGVAMHLRRPSPTPAGRAGSQQVRPEPNGRPAIPSHPDASATSRDSSANAP